MALYEHIFLARQDVSAQQVEELTNALTEVLVQGGGKVTKNEYWGLKSLSYRIKKNRKAHYSLLNIDAPSAAVTEMERQMRINEDILRFMTVRVDELEEGPSAMMQKRDRDDRDGERGGRPDRGGDRFGGERRPRRF
ncbi:30S ribosomal protein S6 [Devosia sp.]|uniref:30S ribosomal protein S6 n=1 Tax=Devosia sp. TaxID=1871048 RepID=UPI002EF9B9BA